MKKLTLLTLLLITALTTFSATITVTNTNDAGAGSLRQAIMDASESDTIRFNPNLISTGSNTIYLNSYLSFEKGLVFKGLYNSTDTLYISGNNTCQIFEVNLSLATNKNLTIDSLVLINANAGLSAGGAIKFYNGNSLFISNSIIENNSSDNDGGGIYINAAAAIYINNSIINNNSATNNGGGIWTSQCTIDINNSTISNNSASTGGGIFSFSSMTITISNSVLENNISDHAGGIYAENNSAMSVNFTNTLITNNTANIDDGGGIYVRTQSNPLSIALINSTITNNSALNGGGLHMRSFDSAVTMMVTNSTIANNTADINGGGIYSQSGSYPLSISITNSTIANNSSDINGGGIFARSDNSSSSVTVTNSSIINNSSTQGSGLYEIAPSLYSETNMKGSIIHNGNNNIYIYPTAPITSQGYNIFNDSPSGTISTDQTNITALQLNLGPLQNNGGTTQTVLPLCSSIAINAGDPTDVSNAQNGSICQSVRDIGAAENCGPSSTTSTITTTACNSYTSPSGKIFTISNTYLDTIPNIGGCDSIITIDLTINTLNNGVTVDGNLLTASETGATYQWLNCPSYSIINGATNQNYTASTNGNYAVIVSKNGCIDTSSCNYSGPYLGLDLAGSGNKVTTTYYLDIMNGFTVEYDMYMHTLQDYNAGVTATCGNKSMPLDFYFNNSGLESIITGNCNSVTSSNAANGFVSGQWYHIAIAYNKSDITSYLYIDGIQTDSVVRELDQSSPQFIIGDRDDGATNAEAKYDNVRIWSVTRTQQEILDNMSTCLSGLETGLDILYEMEEGSGTLINDLALGNGAQNGVITGAVKWNSGTYPHKTSNINPVSCINYLSPAGNTYTATNIYKDTIPSALGCDSIITIDLTINPVDISTTNAEPMITSNAISATYQWLDCNNSYSEINGETNANFTATNNGNYAVEVTQNGCTDTSSCINIANVGIETLSFKQVSIYPNPVTSILYIDLGTVNQTYSFTLTSIDGKIIDEKTQLNQSKISVDLSNHTSGIYLIKLANNDETSIFKIVKE